MMTKWTKEQELAIYESGKNIIVSAGAGSGKTAVLSERVLQKLEKGTSIEQLLILTFTNAAAKEMKERIRKKIKANPLLSKEVNKIETSYITTFDSFSLSIVKKYHYLLNIPQDINIIDKSILEMKTKEYLEEIFNELYLKEDEDFLHLISDFCIKDDNVIKMGIQTINEKLNMLNNKEAYLDHYLDHEYNEEVINNNVEKYLDYIKERINYLDILVKQLSNYVDTDYLEKLLNILNPLLESHSYEDFKTVFGIKLPNLKQGTEETGKSLKKEITEVLKEIANLVRYPNRDQLTKTILLTKPYAKAIITIIKELDSKIKKYKDDNGLYDFIDISKLAIRIIQNDDIVREGLKNQFKEILVDEYQDTNDLQEIFINSISNNNLYMVGDIKQSIYRFRNANPQIFKDKYTLYSQNDGGVKIDLLKNFRSRKEVVDNINVIFDAIMDFDLGGANYQESHEMLFGNEAYFQEGLTSYNNELEIYDYPYTKELGYKKEEIEAFIIADDILNKVASKYQVFDKDMQKLRDINYSDFAILIDRASSFDLYKKIFLYKNIPLNIYRDEYLTKSDELLVIKNIFQLICLVKAKQFNKNYIYSFLSIGRSFLCNYDDNYLFTIIKNNNYYDTSIMKNIMKIMEDIDSLSIGLILDRIMDEFDVYNKLITIGNVKESLVRINYLYDLSANLNKIGYNYQDFYAFLDVLNTNDMDIKFSLNKDIPNSVKIMTIHKSKGLEYPLCYFSGLTTKFNESDIKEKFIYDANLGIITPYFMEGIDDTFYKQLFKNDYQKAEISEKIRLFYVAMTRAREKMIFVVPFNDNEDEYEEGIVDERVRLSYRSFKDILMSVKPKIMNYIKKVDIDSLKLTKDYSNVTINNIFSKIYKSCDKISILEFPKYEKKIMEKEHFSKSISLLDLSTRDKLDFGTKMHYLFEILDLKTSNLNSLELNEQERLSLERFISSPLLQKVKEATIYKEYEFMYQEKGSLKHGVIDLMLEYPKYIDIIDYKLKNIKDNNYLQQLKGYQEYIHHKTKKDVNIYLYSIALGVYQKID